MPGCYTAPVALPILAQVFDEEGTLDRLEGFVAGHGAAFYGLAPGASEVTLERCPPWSPKPVAAGDETVTVFDPGSPLLWRVADRHETET